MSFFVLWFSYCGEGYPSPGVLFVGLHLAIPAEEGNAVFPVFQSAFAENIVGIKNGLFVILGWDDALGNPYTEKVHQFVGLEGR